LTDIGASTLAPWRFPWFTRRTYVMRTDANAVALLIEARRHLGLSQGSLGELLGSSRRTAQRWETTHTKPSDEQWQELARHIHPHDPSLASELALMGKSSLSALGLEKPPPPPLPAPQLPSPHRGLAPQPPPIVVSPAQHPMPELPPEVVDSVVCAAAEAMNVMPAGARPGLFAAFERAEKIGLTVSQVVRALRPFVPGSGVGRSG
jgi:hypothetical protein